MLVWNSRPKDDLARHTLLPQPGTLLSPKAAQDLAVAVAWRGVGNVAPNPLVGAVIVDCQHRFLAAGAHEQVGANHAEINAFLALRELNDPALSANGGTLYVTLEPCAHSGRTPACAPQVVASGVTRVVYGAVDPNPAVNGRGAALLMKQGIAAAHDPQWEDACERLAEIFLWNIRQRRPFVALKAATSLDGVIARPGDKRAWITGERARAYGHFLRTHYDAVAVGLGTLMADDPRLDARLSLKSGRAPWRIVLDPDGDALRTRPTLDWQVIGNDPERVLWVQSDASRDPALHQALASRGIEHLALPRQPHGMIAPADLLTALRERGITSLLLEGGAGLYGSFLRAGLVNKLHLFQAPRLMGRQGALSWTESVGPLDFKIGATTEITALGDDWVLETTLR